MSQTTIKRGKRLAMLLLCSITYSETKDNEKYGKLENSIGSVCMEENQND